MVAEKGSLSTQNSSRFRWKEKETSSRASLWNEGKGNKFKGFIMEQRKGFISWIRFGESGMRNLLKGVEIIHKEASKVKRVFD